MIFFKFTENYQNLNAFRHLIEQKNLSNFLNFSIFSSLPKRQLIIK